MRAVWVALSCNNACLFCPQHAARDAEPSDFFSPAAVTARVQLAAQGGEAVALVGGEPTLRPDLFDLIRLARQQGARAVVVQTNGRRLAYASYARGLAAAGATAVDVSLHGSTAAMHDFHTQAAGSFAQTVTALGVARAAGLTVGVSVALTRSNFRHASEIARVAVTRGARALQLSPVCQLAGAAPLAPSLLPSAEMLRPFVLDAARVARSLGAEVLLDGRASHPSLLDLFAGVGLPAPP